MFGRCVDGSRTLMKITEEVRDYVIKQLSANPRASRSAWLTRPRNSNNPAARSTAAHNDSGTEKRLLNPFGIWAWVAAGLWASRCA